MDFPIELVWIIPILIAFILGLCPKPVLSYSLIAILTIIGLTYFISGYQEEKQGMLLMAILMALPYIAGITILASIIGSKIKKFKNKKCCKISILISAIFILGVGTHTFIKINNIRKDKYLVEQAIKTVQINPLVVKEAGENPKITLFGQEFNDRNEINSVEIRIKGNKILYALLDVNKEKEIQLKCITPLAPMKRVKNWNNTCLK